MPSSTALQFPSLISYPSPPPSPCPWLWRCHSCHIWYRLATTRRCLECDHHFCLSDTATGRSSTKKRKRSSGPCRAEFDYIGWAARGAWRRTLLLNTAHENKTSTGGRRTDHSKKAGTKPLPSYAENNDDDEGGILLGHRRWLPKSSLMKAWGDEHRALELGIEQLTDKFAEKKEALYVRRRHSCWLHCDFPSECHHAVYKAQQEGKPVLAKARALDRAYLAKVTEEEEGSVRKTCVDVLRRELLARFSDESSDSDYSDSEDFDGDVDVDDMDSLPSSPPTEEEVLEGQQQPVVVSPILSDNDGHIPIRISFDMEEDYSYSTFKKEAGIEVPLTYISSIPPKAPQSFEIHVDDDVSDFVSLVETTATTSSTNLPKSHPFERFWTAKKPSTSLITTLRARTTAPPSPIEPPASPINAATSAHDRLEQAYSSQAWFSPLASSTTCSSSNEELKKNNSKARTLSRRRRAATTSRTENTANMMKLLGRRTSVPSSAGECRDAVTTSVFEAWDDDSDIKSEHQL